jgi:hypothetical protein
MVQHYLLVREGRAMPILFCLKEKKQGRRRGIGWMDFTAEMQKGEKKKTRPPCVERSTSGERRTASLLLFFCFVVVVGVALRGNHFLAAKKKGESTTERKKRKERRGPFTWSCMTTTTEKENGSRSFEIVRRSTLSHTPPNPGFLFLFFPLSPSHPVYSSGGR